MWERQPQGADRPHAYPLKGQKSRFYLFFKEAVLDRSEGVLPRLDAGFSRLACRLPLASKLAGVKGWAFVLSWCHRLSGILLLLFLAAHIFTLSTLAEPQGYDAKMGLFNFFLLAFLEWLLAVPVIFHALNGGRLILYEGFAVREDRVMMRWVVALSLSYMALLGWAMLKANESISPSIFWLCAFGGGLFVSAGTAGRFWRKPQALFWRLQRISGALLLVLVPAHMFFMHLNFPAGHQASVVIQRMQSLFIRGVDLVLLAAVLFHGAYGAFSIISDYVGQRAARGAMGALLVAIFVVLGWIGLRVLLSV